jgi:glutaminase
MQAIKSAIEKAYISAQSNPGGRSATYIPELAKTNPDLLAIAICDRDNQIFSKGDVEVGFTLQSISKVFAYALALEHYSEEDIDEKVGLEPSGEVFDSIIKLDKYQRPFNPMVNAGAIAVTDLIISRFGKDSLEQSLHFFSQLIGAAEIQVNTAVFQSEYEHGERNRALAHLLKSFEILDNPVDDVLRLYFQHCSLQVTCMELAQMGATLARNGSNAMGTQVIKRENIRKLLSVMLSCGMYNYAGQWVYEVGLPAKSGVSGGILAVVPEQYGLAVYSPPINEDGCSHRGAHALKNICRELKLHIFDLEG